MMFWVVGIFSLLVAGSIFYLAVWMLAGDLCGAPYVPSDKQFLAEIFAQAKFRKNKRFLDIGSGDGRAVRLAAKKYQLVATGIEIQPFWVWYSRTIDRIEKLKNTRYLRRSFYSGKLPTADYIFFYLFPGTVEKLGQKILSECKPGTMVISRAFEVKVMKHKLVKKIEIDGRRAYFYLV